MLNKLFNVNMRNGKKLLLIGYCVMNEKKRLTRECQPLSQFYALIEFFFTACGLHIPRILLYCNG